MTPAAVLLSLWLLQAAARAADAVEPALRAAVERFFELQEKEDVAGYLALWSPSGTPPRPEQLKYVFDNGDDKFSDLVISRVSINGDRARVRIDVRRERSSTAKPDGTPFVSAYSDEHRADLREGRAATGSCSAKARRQTIWRPRCSRRQTMPRAKRCSRRSRPSPASR